MRTQHNLKTILVVGGAGYIGSHMVKLLIQSSYTPIVLDNLSSGTKESVTGAILIVGDAGDEKLIEKIYSQYHFAAVMHFAASIQVEESVQDPLKYYQNNIAVTLNLLRVMNKLAVKKLVFSSTAAVYGDPKYIPIDEKHPTLPVNPYGRSKLMIEEILQDSDRAYGLRFAALRYFNVSGGDPAIDFAKRNSPVTHLIPLVLQAASGRKASITVFGRDYATTDGTCVRDYIHVKDLCRAHLFALQALLDGKNSFAYNLGAGKGYSVQEVIDMAKMVTHRDIVVVDGVRRAGDSACLVADGSLAQQELHWQPTHSDLQTILQDAWQFECQVMPS